MGRVSKLSSNAEAFARAHADWQAYWQTRSQRDTDEYAALAWYHNYVRAPQQALASWIDKAVQARSKLNMTSHLELFDWWTPTEIEERSPRTPEEARALNSLGVGLSHATLGNRSMNLRRAIACYEAALRVRTESDFPSDWAKTQNNLGNAYRDLPTGDRDENLRRAIAHYEAALRVRTELDFPSDWAWTRFNLGLTFRDLGMLSESMQAFESAARGYETVGDRDSAESARVGAEESRPLRRPQTETG
jgi:tetratricopeptide (TPR) repeat protein